MTWAVDTLAERDALRYRRPGSQISAADIGAEIRVGAAAPYAYYRLEGVEPLAWSADLAAVGGSVAYGTTAGTACEGNDARLSDARQLAAGADKTKLDALPDAAALASTYAVKAVEKGFRTRRPVAGADTPTAADLGAEINDTGASTHQITIPAAMAGVADGNVLTWCFEGAGTVTFAPESVAVTLVPPVGQTLVVLPHEAGKCRWVQATYKTGNAWRFSGHLVGT